MNNTQTTTDPFTKCGYCDEILAVCLSSGDCIRRINAQLLEQNAALLAALKAIVAIAGDRSYERNVGMFEMARRAEATIAQTEAQ